MSTCSGPDGVLNAAGNRQRPFTCGTLPGQQKVFLVVH
jgi:hypothetical protein